MGLNFAIFLFVFVSVVFEGTDTLDSRREVVCRLGCWGFSGNSDRPGPLSILQVLQGGLQGRWEHSGVVCRRGGGMFRDLLVTKLETINMFRNI